MNLTGAADSERGLAAEIRERVEVRLRRGPKTNEGVYKMIFKGDITTGEGMIRLTERLLREFAAGKIPHRRFEAMLRAVRLIATLRRQFPAPPVDGPQEPMNDPAAAFHADGFESRSRALRRSACEKTRADRSYARSRSKPSPARPGACKSMATAGPRTLSRKRAGEGVTRARNDWRFA